MRIAKKVFFNFKGLVYPAVFIVVMAIVAPLQAINKPSSNYLHVTGWVVKDDKPLSGTEITISEDGVVISNMKTNFAGSFSLFVPFQKEYLVTFTKEGLITKKVIIDTNTPDDPDPLFYYYFQFEVELFEDSPYARREFFRDPVAIVFYDVGVHDFEYYRSNVRVFSAKAQNLFKDSLGVVFEYPESFFEYIQSLTEQPDQLRMIADKEPAAEPPLTEEDIAEIPEEHIPIQTEEHQHEKVITFYNYLNGELLDIGQEKFYTVQLLATARPVPEGYFDPAIDALQLQEIIYYRDCDHLHKYTVGVYGNLREAFSVSRRLEEMGYEIFIVSFVNHRRLW